MLRLNVDGKPPAVAGDGVDDAFVNAALTEYFLLLYAVKLGIFFKIQIVKKPDDAPELLLASVAELFAKYRMTPSTVSACLI